MSEDDLEKYGFSRMVYNVSRYKQETHYTKTRDKCVMECKYSLESISHKINGKEVSRTEFFEEAIK